MPREIVGKVPDFTSDEELAGTKEVKQATTEEVVEEEKETPTEPPAEEKPAEGSETPPAIDTSELVKQVEGLQTEKDKLLEEIKSLRGARRELKQQEIEKVQERIDELKDLHPDDIAVIEKVLRAKGYVTREESHKMYYEAVKQEKLNLFLEKYPEYKPENDANDINWNALQRELQYYRMPENPHEIATILERAHRSIQRVPGGQDIEVKKQQLRTASLGSTSGISRPSSTKTLPLRLKEEYRRGGWSEEEINEIEKNWE